MASLLDADAPAWETSKENVALRKGGRDVAKLNRAFGEVAVADARGAERARLEAALAGDALEPWLRYVAWLEEAFPSDAACAFEARERCARRFRDREDPCPGNPGTFGLFGVRDVKWLTRDACRCSFEQKRPKSDFPRRRRGAQERRALRGRLARARARAPGARRRHARRRYVDRLQRPDDAFKFMLKKKVGDKRGGRVDVSSTRVDERLRPVPFRADSVTLRCAAFWVAWALHAEAQAPRRVAVTASSDFEPIRY